MGTEFIVLAAAAALLAYAILNAREGGLMVAVLSYASVVGWIIQSDLGLLMPALGIAIVLAVSGLGVMIYRENSLQDDTSRHHDDKLRANNKAAIETIGS